METSNRSLPENFKWVEISRKKSERFEILSTFLNSNGMKNTFEHIPYTGTESLHELIQKCQVDCHSIRFGFELWNQLNDVVNKNYSDVLRLQSIDALYLDTKDGWWPHLHFGEALSYYLSQYEKKLVTTDPVLVIGSNGMARAAIQGLIALGFSQVNIAGDNEAEAKQLKNDLEKIFFNTQFTFTEKDGLTLLPGIYNVVVNTLDFPEKDEYLRDLYFFNFLKKGGLTVDINEVPLETPLTFIAKDIGAKTIAGAEILSYSDFLWVQTAFGKSLSWESYRDQVVQTLESHKVAEEVIKQIRVEFQIK